MRSLGGDPAHARHMPSGRCTCMTFLVMRHRPLDSMAALIKCHRLLAAEHPHTFRYAMASTGLLFYGRCKLLILALRMPLDMVLPALQLLCHLEKPACQQYMETK